MRLTLRRAAAFAACAASFTTAAQDNAYLDLSLDDLLNVRVNISSITEKPVREQPGIVSVITASEIRAQGARDLVDVLQLVPGYHFGTDIGGVVGPIFRGLWAYEGKTQIIVDGIELNEGGYGTIQLHRHFPAEQIRQLEIIRGPGSALYGGTAELSVIRITTKGAELEGGFASATLGVTDNAVSHHVAFATGGTFGDWRLSLSGALAEDYLSDEDYVDLDGFSYSLADESGLQPYNLNAGIAWRDLQVRVIYDFFDIRAFHSAGSVASTPRAYEFPTFAVFADYDFHPTDWWTITPRFTYRAQTPWRRIRTNGIQGIDITRTTYGLTNLLRLGEASNLQVGFEYYLDEGEVDELPNPADAATYFGGTSSTVDYDDWSVAAQYEVDTDWVNVTLGGRYEHHSAVGGSFVPRIGLTRAWDRLHVKALYAQSFRTPNIRVINELADPSAPLEAEQTSAWEVEVGYQFSPHLAVVGNVFYTAVDGPYVYVDNAGGYLAAGEVTTYGLEAEARYVQTWGSLGFGYSLYRAADNTVAVFATDDDATLLGAPNHKLTAKGTFHLAENLTWHVNGILTSELKAYVPLESGVGSYDPTFLLNTYLEYRAGGLSLGVGVNDLAASGRLFAQPYNGGHAVLPDKTREFYVRAGYAF